TPQSGEPGSGSNLSLVGRQVSLPDIMNRLGFTVLVPKRLDAPDAVFDGSRPGRPGLLMVWQPDDGPQHVSTTVKLSESVGGDDPILVNAVEVQHGSFAGAWLESP